MNLSNVINQLKQFCPILGQRVAGAATFADGLANNANLSLPAAYVLPSNVTAAPNQILNGLKQITQEQVQVIIEIDNSMDRRGQGGASQIDALRPAVFSALLNWIDLNDWHYAARGLYLVGEEVLSMDAARLWYSMTFAKEIQLSELDGFIPVYPDLVEIDLTETNTGIVAAATNLNE